MSENRPTMLEIVNSWAAKHHHRFYNREEQLDELMSNFKDYGYGREDIKYPVRKRIIDVMYLKTWAKAKEWKSCAEEDLEIALESYWPKAIIREANPENKVIKSAAPERPNYPPRRTPPEPAKEEVSEPVPERVLDTTKMREGIETTPLETDELLKELGSLFEEVDDGRSE